MRYYHVAPGTYEVGDDLCSYDWLAAHGRDPGWKWDQVYAETNVVALFRQHAEATAHQSQFGGTIYCVELPGAYEREHVRPNRERFPSVRDRIPGQHVCRLEDY